MVLGARAGECSVLLIFCFLFPSLLKGQLSIISTPIIVQIVFLTFRNARVVTTTHVTTSMPWKRPLKDNTLNPFDCKFPGQSAPNNYLIRRHVGARWMSSWQLGDLDTFSWPVRVFSHVVRIQCCDWLALTL